MLAAARKNAASIAKINAEAEKELDRRVDLVRELHAAGMNFTQIGEIYGLSKQRIFAIVQPQGRSATR